MSWLERYDRWLHNRIMNPFFTWIQKLFHWNRLQLILWALRGIALGYLIQTAAALILAFTQPHDENWPIYPIGGFVFLFLGRGDMRRAVILGRDLKKAAERFEENLSLRLSVELIVYANKTRASRPMISLTRTVFFCWIGVWILHDNWTTSGIAIALGVGMLLVPLSRLVESHLWDVDDIDPKDRLSLFDPQRQEA